METHRLYKHLKCPFGISLLCSVLFPSYTDGEMENMAEDH